LIGLDHRLQYDEALNPSRIEVEQRHHFVQRIRILLEEFRPTLIADESAHTTYAPFVKLFAHLPTFCVEIPDEIRDDPMRKLIVGRDGERLCPYVDSRRERFWRWRIFQHTKNDPSARVLMWLGAAHLHSTSEKLVSFPELLRKAGYSVSALDLREETWWNASWTKDWHDPNPPRDKPDEGFPCCLRDHSNNMTFGCREKIPETIGEVLDDPFDGLFDL